MNNIYTLQHSLNAPLDAEQISISALESFKMTITKNSD